MIDEQPRVSFPEFVAWEQDQTERHEFIGGRITLVSGRIVLGLARNAALLSEPKSLNPDVDGVENFYGELMTSKPCSCAERLETVLVPVALVIVLSNDCVVFAV